MKYDNKEIFFSYSDSYFLRILAMLFVVIAHFFQGCEGKGLAIPMISVMTKTGRYGVAVFFMLSGYGLVKATVKEDSWKKLIIRILRIYIPYIVIEGIDMMCSGNNSFHKWIFFVLCLNCWFLFVLMMMYICYSFSNILFESVNLPLLLVVVISSVICILFQLDTVWYSSNIAFVIGTFAATYEKCIFERTSLPKWLFCLSISFLLFTITGVMYFSLVGIAYIGFKILCTVFYCFLILFLFMRISVSRNRILYFGKTTLFVYLVHGYLITWMMNSNINWCIALLIVVVGAFLWAALLYYTFEKLLFKRLG